MFFKICFNCNHGGVKDGQSHCGKEAVYSYLTNCIQKVALEDYVKRNALKEVDKNSFEVLNELAS